MDLCPPDVNRALDLDVTDHPFSRQIAAFATMHGKEQAFAGPLMAACGLALRVPDGLDTDRFGTFSGDVAREGAATEAATAKAKLGMAVTGLSLGLASEGSFGPHPELPFAAVGVETVVFLDDRISLRVVEHLVCLDTNYGTLTTRSGDIGVFLKQVHFPSHALIVRPNAAAPGVALSKGIVDAARLQDAIVEAALASRDGHAFVQTDMRAHLNPSRMACLQRLAQKLATRLRTLCSACAMPGFGLVGATPGLPCSDCGLATSLTLHEVHGCSICGHREIKPRADGRTTANAGQCPICNP